MHFWEKYHWPGIRDIETEKSMWIYIKNNYFGIFNNNNNHKRSFLM